MFFLNVAANGIGFLICTIENRMKVVTSLIVIHIMVLSSLFGVWVVEICLCICAEDHVRIVVRNVGL